MSNRSVTTDYATVTNSNTGQNGAEFTNPDIILNDDCLACRQRTLDWWNIRTVRMIAAVDAVVMVRNIDFAAHENIVTNFYMIDTTDVDILAETYIVADDKTRCKMLYMSPPYEHIVSIHSPLAAEKCCPIFIFSTPLIRASWYTLRSQRLNVYRENNILHMRR